MPLTCNCALEKVMQPKKCNAANRTNHRGPGLILVLALVMVLVLVQENLISVSARPIAPLLDVVRTPS